LHHSRLPHNLWPEVICFAVWLKNCVTTKVLGTVTPYEKLYGHNKPDLARLPHWGQPIWVHDSSGSKLDAQAMLACWIGYDQGRPHAHSLLA